MDIAKKRKMMEILRGLIGSGFIGGQAEIANYLKKKGFNVAQSTVSRALTKMGAVKTNKDGKIMYTLSPTNHAPQFTGQSLDNLILSVDQNESLIVVRTTPGSAMFVAGFVDHYCIDFCIGTVAGDDTILVVPKSTKKVKAYSSQLSSFFASKE